MTAIWEKLIVLLNQTLEIYQALLQLSRKKRETLIAADPQTLEQLTKQEEMLIIEAGKLEKQRLPLLQDIAAAVGIPSREVTLTALINCAESQNAAKLIAFSEKFTEIADELAKLNEINEKLIKQSLDFIRFNINVLGQTKAEHTYAPNKQDGSGPGRSFLDAKI